MNMGRRNIVIGLVSLAGFMVLGFVLIWLRDFAPGKEAWIRDYGVGKHFETRLAHVHGNLFSLLNVGIGFALRHFRLPDGRAALISWLAIAGLLMPVGILLEVLLGAPPLFVLVGALAMIAAIVLLAATIHRSPDNA